MQNKLNISSMLLGVLLLLIAFVFNIKEEDMVWFVLWGSLFGTTGFMDWILDVKIKWF